jgi:hypothetical protein
MSAVAVITPLVIANWPVIAAAVTAAVSSLGFTTAQATATAGVGVKASGRTKVEVEIEESEVVEGMGGRQELNVRRADGVTAKITRDDQGRLKVCVEGDHLSKAALREIGEEIVGRITQQYVYNKLMTDLQNKNVSVVDQEVLQDQTIKIRIRS